MTPVTIFSLFPRLILLVLCGTALGASLSWLVHGEVVPSWVRFGCALSMVIATGLVLFWAWVHTGSSLLARAATRFQQAPNYAHARDQWALGLAIALASKGMLDNDGDNRFVPSIPAIIRRHAHQNSALFDDPIVRTTQLAAARHLSSPWERWMFMGMNHEMFLLPKLTAHQILLAHRAHSTA